MIFMVDFNLLNACIFIPTVVYLNKGFCIPSEEFVAHSPGTITCISLGSKSARVLATGGEDRRVKLWAVGKPTCIMSLAGHTSSVESAEFSRNEDCIAAGSLSGTIRVWDLEEVKSNSRGYYTYRLSSSKIIFWNFSDACALGAHFFSQNTGISSTWQFYCFGFHGLHH